MDTIERAINKRKSDTFNIQPELTDPDDCKDNDNVDLTVDSISGDNFVKPGTIEQKNESKQFSTRAEKILSSKERASQQVDINTSQLESLGFLSLIDSNNLLSHEFSEIKRPILQNIKGKSAHKIDRANLIQVTSSLQGEGKTFTAINLALSFAKELDYRVLLVDADIIKSSITKILDIEVELGLTDYLHGDVGDLSEVMLKTNIPKLSLLPAGQKHHLSTELLNSQFMENLIQELSERYHDRIVIIDSPPLLETNESRVLAHKVGQIVFVVEHNKTTEASIKDALSLLDPEMVIGLVMNKSRTTSQSAYYGYGSE